MPKITYDSVRASVEDELAVSSSVSGYLSKKNLMKLLGLALLIVVGIAIWVMLDKNTNTGGPIYSVIIDAGSTGSRIHIYKFEQTGSNQKSQKLVDETFSRLKPGLSSYETDSKAAAESLSPLLELAMKTVPKSARAATPIAVGATAGLRVLSDEQQKAILDAVENIIKTKTEFYLAKTTPPRVRILEGNDEGKFSWLAVNMLLGKICQPPEGTHPVCDLGGGSMQCTYAFTPTKLRLNGNVKAYLETVTTCGKTYHLYTHSYLGYGLMAARMKAFKESKNTGSACLPEGFKGTFKNKDESAEAVAGSGSSFEKCREITRQILHKDKKCELESGCSFDGAWGGGLGPALKQPATHAHLLSYFFDRLSHVKAGTFQEGVTGTANLHDLKKKAVALCKLSHEELGGLKAGDGEDDTFSSAPQSKDLPYLCLDLSYIYELLKTGIGMPAAPKQFSLDKKIFSGGKAYESQWALGMAATMM